MSCGRRSCPSRRRRAVESSRVPSSRATRRHRTPRSPRSQRTRRRRRPPASSSPRARPARRSSARSTTRPLRPAPLRTPSRSRRASTASRSAPRTPPATSIPRPPATAGRSRRRRSRREGAHLVQGAAGDRPEVSLRHSDPARDLRLAESERQQQSHHLALEIGEPRPRRRVAALVHPHPDDLSTGQRPNVDVDPALHLGAALSPATGQADQRHTRVAGSEELDRLRPELSPHLAKLGEEPLDLVASAIRAWLGKLVVAVKREVGINLLEREGIAAIPRRIPAPYEIYVLACHRGDYAAAFSGWPARSRDPRARTFRWRRRGLRAGSCR